MSPPGRSDSSPYRLTASKPTPGHGSRGFVGAKAQEFEQLALELAADRHKALVFSQFTDFLKLVGERLDGCGISYQYLDGSTPAAERGKRVVAFQRAAGDPFLISLKAGGFGLNLTAADYVLIVTQGGTPQPKARPWAAPTASASNAR